MFRANKKWLESQAINLLKRLWPEVENDSPSPDDVKNVPLCDRAITKEADEKAPVLTLSLAQIIRPPFQTGGLPKPQSRHLDAAWLGGVLPMLGSTRPCIAGPEKLFTAQIFKNKRAVPKAGHYTDKMR